MPKCCMCRSRTYQRTPYLQHTTHHAPTHRWPSFCPLYVSSTTTSSMCPTCEDGQSLCMNTSLHRCHVNTKHTRTYMLNVGMHAKCATSHGIACHMLTCHMLTCMLVSVSYGNHQSIFRTVCAHFATAMDDLLLHSHRSRADYPANRRVCPMGGGSIHKRLYVTGIKQQGLPHAQRDSLVSLRLHILMYFATGSHMTCAP